MPKASVQDKGLWPKLSDKLNHKISRKPSQTSSALTATKRKNDQAFLRSEEPGVGKPACGGQIRYCASKSIHTSQAVHKLCDIKCAPRTICVYAITLPNNNARIQPHLAKRAWLSLKAKYTANKANPPLAWPPGKQWPAATPAGKLPNSAM